MSSPEEIKDVVEIPEVEVAIEAPEISLEGLSSQEKALAEKHGLVPKEVEVKTEEKKPEEKETPTFEETEKNEKDLLKNYNKNEQALYFKWKSDKRERQSAQREAELATIREKALKSELEKIKQNETITEDKLVKINNLLNGPQENITIEALQEILKAQAVAKVAEDKKRPITVEDLERIQEKKAVEQKELEEKQKFLAQRISDAENYGKSKFENYDDIINSAQEVLEGKVKIPAIINIADISARLAEAVHNKDVDFDTIADYVNGIAKLNPNFGQSKSPSNSSQKKETNENIDRILKNASKQQTTASVSGGNGRRLVSYEDLTLEDAARLSSEQYAKLPDTVRKRLKQEASQI